MTLILLMLSVAFGAPKPPLVIDITTPAGAPLPSTILRFHAEGKVHLAPNTGRVEMFELTLPDGTTRALAAGQKVVFDVWAPGFAPTTMRLELAKPKNNRARVLLNPAKFDAMGDPWATAALEAAKTWEEAQLRWWNDRSEANGKAAAKLRSAAAAKAKLWYDSLARDPDTDAARLCRITTSDPTACGAAP
jgi:hypothetical protein